MRKTCLHFLLIVLLSSCATLEHKPLSYLQHIKRPISYTGMVIGSIESPMVLNLSQTAFPTPYTRLNKPLNLEVREALSRIDESWEDQKKSVASGQLIHAREAIFSQEGLLELRKHGETYDTFSDLAGKDTIVLVALSGGGLRAARLAAHALRELEQSYVQLSTEYIESPKAMHEQIDAISSVSGGSIYSALVARQYANDLTSLLPAQFMDPIERQFRNLPFISGELDSRATHFFRELERSPTVRWRTRSLGIYGLFSYLTPFTIPLYFLTDYGYTHHLAITLDLYPDLLPLTFTFEDLPRFAPRFFFTATDTHTGAPFVFTQSIVHLPSERVLDVPSAQEELLLAEQVPDDSRKNIYPLFNALTLEDINSSPARFPVSMAAMTSAAFPGFLNPVRLCTYGYDPMKRDIYRSDSPIDLFDGGVYDNSGLTVLADLVEYLTLNASGSASKPKTVLLLSINAEITRFDPNEIKRKTRSDQEPRKKGFDFFNFAPPWPFSALGSGMTGVYQVHFLNKRRAEEMAVGRLRSLERKNQIDFYYFPVNLSEIEWSTSEIKQPVTLEQLQTISTALALRGDEDQLLNQAAKYLLHKDRQGYEALDTGEGGAQTQPTMNASRAWAMALIRAQLGRWEGSVQKVKQPD